MVSNDSRAKSMKLSPMSEPGGMAVTSSSDSSSMSRKEGFLMIERRCMIFSMLLFDLLLVGRGGGTALAGGAGLVARAGLGTGAVTGVESGSGLGAGRGRRGGGGKLRITTGGGEEEGVKVCSIGSGTATSSGTSGSPLCRYGV